MSAPHESTGPAAASPAAALEAEAPGAPDPRPQPAPAPPDFDPKFVEATVARLGRRPEALIPILHALQEKHGYLPAAALEHLGACSDIRPADVTGVATFYDKFRHAPVGKHIVKICTGTACHVAGADKIADALRRHLHIPAGADTDPERQFTIEPVACVGVCTLAPVASIDGEILGHLTPEFVPDKVRDHFVRADQTGPRESTEEPAAAPPAPGGVTIHVGLGSCCMAKGSDELYHALRAGAAQSATPIHVKRVGCMGMCHRTPMIELALPGGGNRYYAGLTPGHAGALVRKHFRPRGLLGRARDAWQAALDGLIVDVEPPAAHVADAEMKPQTPAVRAFLGRQVHIATEHFGRVDPLDLDEYLAHDGFAALRHALADLKPEETIAIIERSGLRGRGGAGFPTGQKWGIMHGQPGPEKYVICNGDEGDPGAFMDRMILESFPFRVIEGLAIAALATGAETGFFYIRHEYPLAVKRVRAALATLARRGWIGERLLGAQRPFRVSVVEGGGAFVCGEETALIQSIEGRRGMPRLRPPFPAEAGLWGKPTLINNVETLALVPWIVRHGGERFAALGTARSKGTKVFALAGHIERGGLIEVPMGTTIREIVEDIGGGVRAGRKFKAVQIGGPSGGCVPARLADTPVDFESLREVGAIMGSGGLVVLDDSTCMVDVARYFLQFTEAQSCGKCTFCRIGTKRMLELLDKLCTGQAHRSHLDELRRLAHQVGAGSLCGLGKTAPNPVLTTLRYFHDEYEAHLQGRCPAGKCTALIKYRINADCTGCTLCAQHCPVDAIPLTPYARHHIDLDLCTRCDTCRKVCPAHAVEVP